MVNSSSITQLLQECREQASRDWLIADRTAIVLFLLPFFLVVIAAILSQGFKPQMRYLEQEDGFLEWLQVVAFAVSFVAALNLSARFFGQGARLAGAAYAMLAAGLFFIIGEELAWGQRLLHFETPQGLAAINEKEEVSIHNIESLKVVFRLLKLLAASYGVFGALWLLNRRRQNSAQPWEPYLLPVFLASPFVVVLVMRIARLTFLSHTVPVGFSEFEETVIAYGVAIFCVLYWRRMRLMDVPGTQGT